MVQNAYLVFCRLVGLETADNPRIASAFLDLTRILNFHCESLNNATVHTSVFGRFAVIRSGVEDAIQLAKAVVKQAVTQGVDLTIGITSGPILEVDDLGKTNWVGHSINVAARLASVDSTLGSIAVSQDVVEDAEDADASLAKAFGPKMIGRVKSTGLEYCRILLEAGKSNPERPSMDVRSENAHVVLYDIVKFSEQEPIRQADLAEGLRRRVEIALDSIGGLTPENLKSCYTSGGDGGGLVFRDGRQNGAIRAWTFARSLRDRSQDIPIRIGIATGQVVFWEDAPPLGMGIFRAERASSFPQAGGICCHSKFWNRELQSGDNWGWTPTPVKNAPEFLIVEWDANPMRPHFHQSQPTSNPAFKPCPDRLPDTGEHLVSREVELAQLDQAWNSEKTKFVQIVAEGGVGKTQLVKKWRDRLLFSEERGGAEQCFVWSFSSLASVDDFFQSALSHFNVSTEIPRVNDSWAKAEALAQAIKQQRTLLILDCTESLQQFDGVLDTSLGNLLDALRDQYRGLCVLTTRLPVEKLKAIDEPSSLTIELKNLSAAAGADLLERFGVRGEPELLQQASTSVGNHALSVILLGSYLKNRYNGDVTYFHQANLFDGTEKYADRAKKMIESYEAWFGEQDDTSKVAVVILRLMGLFDRPAESDLIAELRKEPAIVSLTDSWMAQQHRDLVWNRAVERLREARLLAEDKELAGTLDVHPLIREYYSDWFDNHPEVKRVANLRLYHRLLRAAENTGNDEKTKRQFLCRAIPHGCRAGLHRSVFRELLGNRLLKNDPRMFYQHADLTMSLVFRMREFIKESTQELYLTNTKDQAQFHVWYSHCMAAYRGFIHPDVKPSFQHAVRLAEGRVGLRRELFAGLVGLFRCRLFLAEFNDAVETVNAMEDATKFGWLTRKIIPKELQIRAANTVLQARAEMEFYRGNFNRCSELTGPFLASKVGNQTSYFEMDPVVALHSIASWSNFYLGNVSQSVWNADSAVMHAESLNAGTDQQINQSLAMAYYHAGVAYYEMGDSKVVEQHCKKLGRVVDVLISPFWRALSVCLQALSAKLQGDLHQAECLLFTGIQIWERMARRAMTRFWTILAELRLQLGRQSEAVEALEQAKEYAKSGEHFYLSEVKRVHGLIFPGSSTSRMEGYLSELPLSIAIARKQNALALELRASICYAERLLKSGMKARAMQLLTDVLNRYEDQYQTADVCKANTLLAHLAQDCAKNPA